MSDGVTQQTTRANALASIRRTMGLVFELTFIEVVTHAEDELWIDRVCNTGHKCCNSRLILGAVPTPVTHLKHIGQCSFRFPDAHSVLNARKLVIADIPFCCAILQAAPQTVIASSLVATVRCNILSCCSAKQESEAPQYPATTSKQYSRYVV